MLNENQHRLLMCMRMAKALGKGEIYLDATGHKMCWRMEADGRPSIVFHSIGEMEEYLEHLLENRWRSRHNHLGHTGREVKRRMIVVRERQRARTNGVPMMFPSRINQ